MSGYTIHYTDDAQGDRRAINDLVQYLGHERTKVLIRYGRHPQVTEDQFFMAASFGGVAGRPVGALWRHIRGDS